MYNTERSKAYRDGHPIVSNMMTCHKCNVKIGVKGLPIHLKSCHNITFREYLVEYFDDFKIYGWQMCDNCHVNIVRKDKNKKTSTCSRKCGGELKSILMAGWAPWNAGIKMTDLQKSNLKNRPPSFLGKHHSDEVRAKMSATRIRLGLSKGSKNPMFGKTHTKASLKKIFQRRSMSSAENIAAKVLDEHSIKYRRQFFLTDKSTRKTYSYDFQLSGSLILIEVDGDYWHGGPGLSKYFYNVNEVKENDRIKDIVAADAGYTLIRIWESSLKQNPNILVESINVKTNSVRK